jgi:uncharacterized membrane protein YvlD (DUF360 family)
MPMLWTALVWLALSIFWGVLIRFWWLWLAMALASYVMFNAYVDTPKQKAAVNAVALPSLLALMLPMFREESGLTVPIYFIELGFFFAIAAVLFHFAEQRLRYNQL